MLDSVDRAILTTGFPFWLDKSKAKIESGGLGEFREGEVLEDETVSVLVGDEEDSGEGTLKEAKGRKDRRSFGKLRRRLGADTECESMEVVANRAIEEETEMKEGGGRLDELKVDFWWWMAGNNGILSWAMECTRLIRRVSWFMTNSEFKIFL